MERICRDIDIAGMQGVIKIEARQVMNLMHVLQLHNEHGLLGGHPGSYSRRTFRDMYTQDYNHGAEVRSEHYHHPGFAGMKEY